MRQLLVTEKLTVVAEADGLSCVGRGGSESKAEGVVELTAKVMTAQSKNAPAQESLQRKGFYWILLELYKRSSSF